jgi:hypothetical protein
MASNPLIGSGWGSQPTSNQGQNQNMFSGTNPIQIPGAPGVGGPGLSSPGQGAGKATAYGNPGGFKNPLGNTEIGRNAGLNNIMAGQMKNQLAPQFANLMGQYGGAAGNYFSNLMNLGSPYYQQKQTEGFNQGVQQNQNAMAQAQQGLNASGYGFGPSGARAAMLGGMQQQGAQNIAEQYLQNLFQNEQMQNLGAQGMSSLAGMFNPTQLLGGTSVGTYSTQPQSFGQTFDQIMGGIGSILPKPPSGGGN